MSKHERKSQKPPVPDDSDDLALENLINDLDLTAADAQDLGRMP